MRRMLDMGMAPSNSYVEWRAQKQFELDCDNAAKESGTAHTQIICMHCHQHPNQCICKDVRDIDSIKKRKF